MLTPLLIRSVVLAVLVCWFVIARAMTARARLRTDAPSRPRPVFDCLVLVAAAAICAAAYHTASADGVFAPSRAVRAVKVKHAPLPPLAEVTAAQVRDAIVRGDTLIIDARAPVEYHAGHIDGAVNVQAYPVTEPWPASVQQTPKDRPVIVYCAAEHCKVAAVVGATLLAEGFTDVRLYPGGWEDWIKAPG